MCGIGAIVSKKAIPAAEMIQYCRILSNTQHHRGPDDEGFVLFDIEGNAHVFGGENTLPQLGIPRLETASGNYICALVHRRLSIIAPGAAGHQPMHTADGKLWLTYNGEIFNFKKLNQQNNFSSETGTDSETLLKYIEKNKYKSIPDLDGFYAAMIWNTEEQSLHVFRDPTGVKPLFYSRKGGVWFFASETKPLRLITGYNSPDPTTIFHHLTEGVMGNLPESNYFSAIFSVEKGRLDCWTAQDGLVNLTEFTPDKIPPIHLKERLQHSVKTRLIADVPLGFAVSGGLDSAAIIGLARKELGAAAKLKLFSVTSADANSDESNWQKMVADYNHADWHTTSLEDASNDLLQTVIQATDMPAVAWNNLAHFELCKLAKSHGVTVFFNGQGADEIFGGYPDYLQRDYGVLKQLYQKNAQNWPLTLKEIEAGYRKLKLLKIAPDFIKRYAFNKDLKSILHPDLLPRMSYRWSLAGLSADEKMKEDYYGKKLGQMLVWEDRNGMAHGLESRNPFADDNMLASFLRMPFKQKSKNGFTKGILREALTDVVPGQVLWRTDKKGFTVPDEILTWKQLKNWEPVFMSEILDEWSPRGGREQLLKSLTPQNSKGLKWYFRLTSLAFFLANIHGQK